MNVELMRELIDEIPEGDDRLYDLIIHGGQMYRIIVERLDADQVDESVRDFAMKTNRGNN